MKIFRHSSDLDACLSLKKSSGKTLGFVPTMGALHKGHLALIEQANKENDATIVSIFVNPTQFNNPEDLEKYPVQREKDIEMLCLQGCDILFLPRVQDIYPDGASRQNIYNLGSLDTTLEAKHRPGHFQGVCMVMEQLLKKVSPDRLYLGRKDYQQCLVISRLVEILHLAIEIKIIPIVREPSGLAMSSRNQRLTNEQRGVAPMLYASLNHIKEHRENSSCRELVKAGISRLCQSGFEVEYLVLATETLQLLDNFDAEENMILLTAARLGVIRLIDNLSI